MRGLSTAPTGQERTFGENEIIVSKTDLKGLINYANDVFVRVSGYPRADLIGKPHNLIRHPQMPRGVFHLLWQTISSGHEIFAYVNNLAADGAHYWVLAHVTPTFGADGSIIGYHSNRRLPDRPAIAAVEGLYQRMLAEESRHSRTVDAAAASAALLHAELAESGCSYDEFVWSLISGTGPAQCAA